MTEATVDRPGPVGRVLGENDRPAAVEQDPPLRVPLHGPRQRLALHVTPDRHQLIGRDVVSDPLDLLLGTEIGHNGWLTITWCLTLTALGYVWSRSLFDGAGKR